MRVVFSRFAKQELDDAVRYYEIQVQGLGKRFRREVRRGARRIAQYPEAGSAERGEVRKYLLHKFPYKLLYSIELEHLFIIAVAHQHRKPDYWIRQAESMTQKGASSSKKAKKGPGSNCFDEN